MSLRDWLDYNRGAHPLQQKPVVLDQVPWVWPEEHDGGAVVVTEGEAAEREMKEWEEEQ